MITDNFPVENNGMAIWEKPQAGWVKCNTDGAMFSTAQKLVMDG